MIRMLTPRDRRLGTCLLFVGSWIATVSCGDDDGGGGTSNDRPLEELPAAVATALCDASEACLGPFLELFAAEDCNTSFTRRFEADEFVNLQAAVEAGRVIYRPSRIDDCLERLAVASCSAISNLNEICGEALEGTLGEGEDCSLDTECEGSAFCKRDGSSCPGTCTARQLEGATCDDEDECADGLVCSDELGTCEEPSLAGEPCEGGSGQECDSGLFCFGADEGDQQAGTCESLEDAFAAGSGDECDFLQGQLCQSQLSCVVESASLAGIEARCQTRADSNGPCRLGLPDPCPSGEYCDADFEQLQLEGQCRPLPTEGQACRSGNVPPECAAFHVCLGGTCYRLAENGESCMENDQCYSERCDRGMCTPEPACL